MNSGLTFKMIKRDTTKNKSTVNISSPNKEASKFIKQKQREVQRKFSIKSMIGKFNWLP